MTTLTLNQELNGIEIRFDAKPLQATLDGLKKLGFRWHNKKKLWYAKNTPERLEMAQAIADGEEYAEQIREEEPKKAKPEPVNKYGVKVGDVFYDSWGYEQTNIDFYQVIALRGKTQVVLAAIGAYSRQDGFCSAMVKPKKDDFLTGGYITRLQRHGEKSIIRTVKKFENGSIWAGSGSEMLKLTDWETEHNETSYY